MGYTHAELDDIQDRWKLRFPPDLLDLMRSRRPLMRRGFDWLKTSPAEIQRILEWPFEGIWFDVREGELWWPEWSRKPKALFDQGKKLGEVIVLDIQPSDKGRRRRCGHGGNSLSHRYA